MIWKSSVVLVASYIETRPIGDRLVTTVTPHASSMHACRMCTCRSSAAYSKTYGRLLKYIKIFSSINSALWGRVNLRNFNWGCSYCGQRFRIIRSTHRTPVPVHTAWPWLIGWSLVVNSLLIIFLESVFKSVLTGVGDSWLVTVGWWHSVLTRC